MTLRMIFFDYLTEIHFLFFFKVKDILIKISILTSYIIVIFLFYNISHQQCLELPIRQSKRTKNSKELVRLKSKPS